MTAKLQSGDALLIVDVQKDLFPVAVAGLQVQIASTLRQ